MAAVESKITSVTIVDEQGKRQRLTVAGSVMLTSTYTRDAPYIPQIDLGAFQIKSLSVTTEPAHGPYAAHGDCILRMKAGVNLHPQYAPYMPGMEPVIGGATVLPRYMSREETRQEIRKLILQCLTHELDEWLRIDGERVVDPHDDRTY